MNNNIINNNCYYYYSIIILTIIIISSGMKYDAQCWSSFYIISINLCIIKKEMKEHKLKANLDKIVR